jgi:large subunit ribosomal protein L47
LTERWYAWEDARALAETDPTVNLDAVLREESYVGKDEQDVMEPQEAAQEATQQQARA